MGRLTPPPREVIAKFHALYAENPVHATDWYYRFSQDTNYIRRDRIAKDVQWKTPTEYGELDITINLSKTKKIQKRSQRRATCRQLPIPAASCALRTRAMPAGSTIPRRQNHRIIPITIDGQPWFLQYSPYVYYNEHCICLNSVHTPMKIDRACFRKLPRFRQPVPALFCWLQCRPAHCRRLYSGARPFSGRSL